MSIKQQIISEVELRRKIKGQDKVTIKSIAKTTGISYNNLLKWFNQPERSLGDANLDKVVSALDKKLVMIDKGT
jgi:transposase-like protein